MSDYPRKPGTGVLFKNKNKKTERHPDYNGTWSPEEGDDDYWLSCWINESANGTKYMSLALGGKKEKKQEQSAPASNMSDGSTDDDVPF